MPIVIGSVKELCSSGSMWENYIIIVADRNKHSEESFTCKVILYLEMDNLRLRYNLIFVLEAESAIPSICLLRNTLLIEAHLNSRRAF